MTLRSDQSHGCSIPETLPPNIIDPPEPYRGAEHPPPTYVYFNPLETLTRTRPNYGSIYDPNVDHPVDRVNVGYPVYAILGRN